MKRISKFTAALGVASLLIGAGAPVFAQQGAGGGGGRGGGRGFDPAQMQQRMMERYREMLEITSDDEWKAIEPLVGKVSEARREVGFGGMGRAMFGRPGGGGGPGGPGGAGSGNGGGGGEQGGARRGFGGEPSPESEALQKALDSKASAADIKTALGKVREARKAKEAKLALAQDDLRKVLSVRQEAQAVMAGLLN